MCNFVPKIKPAMTEEELEKLNRLKSQYAPAFQIDDIRWESNFDERSAYREGFPILTVFGCDMEKNFNLDDGWIEDSYDHYMDYHKYHRTVDIRDAKAEIAVEFTKQTDERDKEILGFTSASMKGTYRYPVPTDLKEEITHSIYDKRKLTKGLKNELKRRFSQTLMEDEFNALLRLRDEHLQALLNAIDPKMTKTQQKAALDKASNSVENNNPATDKLYQSRSFVINQRNFDVVYKKARV